MWRTLLTLALASACLALPSPQQNEVPTPAPQTQTTPSADSITAGNPNLDSLFSTGFVDLHNTTPTTFMDTQNNARPQGCKCVPFYLCLDDIPEEDYDLRIDDCEDTSEFCCMHVEDEVTLPPLARKGSGDRHPRGVGLRIAGNTNNEAQFTEFPWMVAILKKLTTDEKNETLDIYRCGGSLIHKQAVLTAAYCVYGQKPSELKIRAGEWDKKTENKNYPHQDRAVQSVIVHEKYVAGSQSFNVAILILSEPVNDAENVDVVCLSEQNAVYDGSRCFASSWGKNKFGKEGHYQAILKKVDLPIVPQDTCQDSLRKTILGKNFKLHESFICAGGEVGKDTCKGDGGNPLVCPSKNDPTRYQQAGIVAWGVGCGEDGIPSVYTSVAHVRNWIDEQIEYNSLDNTVYAL